MKIVLCRLIHASNKPNTVLILEDIQSLGWMKTNQTFATFEDVLPVIQSIAELHAVSYFLHQTVSSILIISYGLPHNIFLVLVYRSLLLRRIVWHRYLNRKQV